MLFIETPIFTREITGLMPDQEYAALQRDLLSRPEAGSIIIGSGGLRKLRWKMPGRGKRGGVRIIYYFDPPARIFMLFPFPKNVQEDLTPSQLKVLKALVKEWLE